MLWLTFYWKLFGLQNKTSVTFVFYSGNDVTLHQSAAPLKLLMGEVNYVHHHFKSNALLENHMS